MSADLARLDDDRALILAGVSHDLRTPLTRLRMGIEMAVADDATRNEMAADIEEMDRSIGQFLDFARADAGEPAAPVDIMTAKNEMVKMSPSPSGKPNAWAENITQIGIFSAAPS